MLLKLRIDGTLFEVPDMEDWTTGDLADASAICGGDLSLIGSDMRGMVALVLVGLRTAKPSTTIDEARAIRMSQVEFLEPDADPLPDGELAPLASTSTTPEARGASGDQ